MIVVIGVVVAIETATAACSVAGSAVPLLLYYFGNKDVMCSLHLKFLGRVSVLHLIIYTVPSCAELY